MFMKPERVWQPIKLFTSEEGGKAGNKNKADFEPREGNFHDAGFQPPHPHPLHH